MRRFALIAAFFSTLLVAATAQSAPKLLQGTVTLNGQPVFHATVSARSHPRQGEALATAFTDPAGHFSLASPAGANLSVRAEWSGPDSADNERELQSADQPAAATVNLALDRLVEAGKVVPLDAKLAAELATGNQPPSLAQWKALQALWMALERERDTAKRATLLAGLPKAMPTSWLFAVVDAAVERKVSEGGAGMTTGGMEVGARAIELANAAGAAELAIAGLHVVAFFADQAGQTADALKCLQMAETAAEQLAKAAPNAGKKRQAQGQLLETWALWRSVMGKSGSDSSVRLQLLANADKARQLAKDLREVPAEAEALLDMGENAAKPADAASWFRQAAQLAHDGGNWSRAALARWRQGLAAHDLPADVSRDDAVVQDLQAGMQDAEAVADALLAARIALAAGRLLAMRERYPQADAQLTQAIARIAGLPKGDERDELEAEARGGVGRGLVRERMERWAEAVPDLQAALAIETRNKHRDRQATCWQLLGSCWEMLGKFEDSRNAWLRAHELFLQAGPEQAQLAFGALSAAALTYASQSPPDLAAQELLTQKGVALAKQRGVPGQAGRLLREMGYSWVLQKGATREQIFNGIGRLEQSVAMLKAAGDSQGVTYSQTFLVLAYRLLGRSDFDVGNDDAGTHHFDKAMAVAKQMGPAGAGDLAAIGDEMAMYHYERGNWAKAEPLWQAYADFLGTPAAAERSQRIVEAQPYITQAQRDLMRPDALRAATLGLLGNCRWSLGKVPQALADLEAQVAALRQVGDRDGQWRTQMQLALYRGAAGQLGQLQADTKKMAAQADNTARKTDVRTLGLFVAVLRGDADVAQQAGALQASLPSRKPTDAASDPQPSEAMAWLMSGNIQLQTGQLRRAAEALERGALLLEPTSRASALGRAADAWRALGQLQLALDALGHVWQRRAQMRAFLTPGDELRTALAVAEVARGLGKADVADAAVAAGQTLATALAARPALLARDSWALRAWGGMRARAALKAGNRETARKELAAVQRWAEGDDMASHELHLMQAAMDGDGAGCERHAAVVAGGGGFATLEVALAALAEHKTPPGLVERLAQKAVARAEEIGNLNALPSLLLLRSRLEFAGGRVEAAEKTTVRAAEVFEALRGDLQADDAKVGYLDANGSAIYGWLRHLRLGLGKPAEALEASERGRGRAMLDLLATAAVAAAQSPSAKDMAAIAERLRSAEHARQLLDLGEFAPQLAAFKSDDVRLQARRVAAPAVQAKLAIAADRETPAQLLAKVAEIKRGFAAAPDQEFASLLAAPQVTAAELQELAKRRNVPVIEFDTSGGEVSTFLVRPDGQVVAQSQVFAADKLAALVRDFRRHSGIGNARGAQLLDEPAPTTADADDENRQLYKLLIGKLDDLLPADPQAPVLLVPHGPLFLLPFAALRDEKGVAWLDKHTLVLAPSLAVLRYTEPMRARAAGNSALLIGNPAMPKLDGQQLAALPGALREAKNVAQLFGNSKQFVPNLLTGAAASEAQVGALAATARVLHLATHGVVVDDRPLDAFVALAPSPGMDGRWTVREVLQLKLKSELVALSACQTGLGRLSGDGVLGLGRAFLYAGAPSVLVSLWSVDDEATALLMQTFYRTWLAGSSKAAALRQAQLTTRAQFADAGRWAAFVLWGEWP